MSPINEPPDNQLINQSLEVDTNTFANGHSDSSYEDTVVSPDKDKQEPVLTRLYEDKVIRGFPTKRLDFNSDDELDCALGELVGELVWDSPIGISQRSTSSSRSLTSKRPRMFGCSLPTGACASHPPAGMVSL